MTPVEILSNQPDFRATECFRITADIRLNTKQTDASACYTLTKVGQVYTRYRGVVINVSRPGGTTLNIYPKSREYVEEPEVDLWYLYAQSPGLLSRRNLSLQKEGEERINGRLCVKIKAEQHEADTGSSHREIAFFYADKGLEHLITRIEILIPPISSAIYELKDISFSPARQDNLVASHYRKSIADPTAAYRLADYFKLSDIDEFSSKSIRSALLSRLPVGTSREEIRAFLSRSGIGGDQLSRYDESDQERLVCTVDYDPTLPGLVKKHYGVFFSLDPTGRLADISVDEWITGP